MECTGYVLFKQFIAHHGIVNQQIDDTTRKAVPRDWILDSNPWKMPEIAMFSDYLHAVFPYANKYEVSTIATALSICRGDQCVKIHWDPVPSTRAYGDYYRPTILTKVPDTQGNKG